jgi:membrane protein DedA with SNARE-associated domain
MDFLPALIEYIRQLPSFIKILVLLFSVAIEYIFPIYPGDTLVVLAGFFSAQDALGIIDVSIAIICGSVAGSIMAYKLGALLIRPKHKYRWVRNLASSPMFTKFNAWYYRYGAYFMIFHRFIPGIKSLFFIAAGSAKLSFTRVMVLGAISAFIYNGCLILLGYWLGFNVELIIDFLYRYALIAYALIILALISGLVVIFLSSRKPR